MSWHGLRPEGHKVLSLYLNLDPSEFPTPRDRSVELESLLDVAERALREDGLDHSQKERAQARPRGSPQVLRRGSSTRAARAGVAIFAASGADLFEVHRLARPIRSEDSIDDSPFIEPLDQLPGDDGYGVLLINRQVARILAGGSPTDARGRSIVDDVHRWHDQGGWSQARYQRGIKKETRDHLKHAATSCSSSSSAAPCSG